MALLAATLSVGAADRCGAGSPDLALPASSTETGPASLLGLDAVGVLEPEPVSMLASANPYVLTPSVGVSLGGGKSKAKPPTTRRSRRSSRMSSVALTPERAQALLRSMTIPGWGQATLGRRTAGAVFGVIESGVWGSFLAFRIQERLRRDASSRTARIFAGVDLQGRDEEFRRLVGAFASSDEYNQLVVFRDAANQFYDEPDRYRDYIATHSLGGANAWKWQDASSFFRYRAQRKDAQRAALRANTALAVAVGNRILSVLHAARAAGHPSAQAGEKRSWNFEVEPGGGDDPTAFRCGIRTSF